ncbi:unnamed protein product [Ectocarpus sp. CCAP 1310/34]|nr:unnamed protein product [Ectocarpus sp. CCAP 1310/34]
MEIGAAALCSGWYVRWEGQGNRE